MSRFKRNALLTLAAAMAVAPAVPTAADPGVARAAGPPAFENPVLRVKVSGAGRPMVLIPGLTCGGDVWDGAVARYADRYECHVVTLGGFAGRPRFDGPFLDTARDSLLAYVRGLESPVIVGHSLGGVLALELAIAAPGAIGPLVIVDALPFLGAAGDSAATEARRTMAPMRDMIRGQSQEAYAAYQRNAPYLRGMVAPGPDFRR